MHFDINDFCIYVNKCKNYKLWNEIVIAAIKENKTTLETSRAVYNNQQCFLDKKHVSLQIYCKDSMIRFIHEYCAKKKIPVPPIEILELLTHNLCKYLGVEYGEV